MFDIYCENSRPPVKQAVLCCLSERREPHPLHIGPVQPLIKFLNSLSPYHSCLEPSLLRFQIPDSFNHSVLLVQLIITL